MVLETPTPCARAARKLRQGRSPIDGCRNGGERPAAPIQFLGPLRSLSKAMDPTGLLFCCQVAYFMSLHIIDDDLSRAMPSRPRPSAVEPGRVAPEIKGGAADDRRFRARRANAV